MSTAVGIAFLLVYVLGAFAYGSALMLSLRQASPVWSPHRHHGSPIRPRLDRASIAMFLWSAVWFVVLALDQFTEFVSGPRRGLLDLAQLLLVFGFPAAHRPHHVPRGPRAGVDRPGARVGDARARRHVHRGTGRARRGDGAGVRGGAGARARRLDRRLAGHALHHRRPLLGDRDEPQPARRRHHPAAPDAAGAERPVRRAGRHERGAGLLGQRHRVVRAGQQADERDAAAVPVGDDLLREPLRVLRSAGQARRAAAGRGAAARRRLRACCCRGSTACPRAPRGRGCSP